LEVCAAHVLQGPWQFKKIGHFPSISVEKMSSHEARGFLKVLW